jgi:FhuF 2Fe-2S C-terminal domain
MPPWRPVSEFAEGPDVLALRVTRVRSALARGGAPDGVDLRVAASVAQLGLVARLLAPAIALHTGDLTMEVESCWWQDELGGPFPLSIALRPGRRFDPVSGVIELLTAATISGYGVPPRTAWGNIASAANSAAQMIARGRPDLADQARTAADVILRDPRVEGGRLRSSPSFRRHSCCLIYQLSGDTSTVCGDCVLVR